MVTFPSYFRTLLNLIMAHWSVAFDSGFDTFFYRTMDRISDGLAFSAKQESTGSGYVLGSPVAIWDRDKKIVKNRRPALQHSGYFQNMSWKKSAHSGQRFTLHNRLLYYRRT